MTEIHGFSCDTCHCFDEASGRGRGYYSPPDGWVTYYGDQVGHLCKKCAKDKGL